MKTTYYQHGKLLLTGEYAVLDGALALALPTKKGQKITITTDTDAPHTLWKSYSDDGALWFQGELFSGRASSPIAQRLEEILLAAQRLRPDFSPQSYFCVETFLEFPQNWGLGSSSTLIAGIAQWARVCPYELLAQTFGGSGYDIACASSATPILYRLEEGKRHIFPVLFSPIFAADIFFIHLNQKQNSREGIARYRNITPKAKQKNITALSQITEQLLQNPTKEHFCELIAQHEAIIAQCIGIPPVKKTLFPDFSGEIKSLGAWGGDFILAIGEKEYLTHYFTQKGYPTIIPFSEMVL